jgi:hypothetical protein
MSLPLMSDEELADFDEPPPGFIELDEGEEEERVQLDPRAVFKMLSE